MRAALVSRILGRIFGMGAAPTVRAAASKMKVDVSVSFMMGMCVDS